MKIKYPTVELTMKVTLAKCEVNQAVEELRDWFLNSDCALCRTGADFIQHGKPRACEDWMRHTLYPQSLEVGDE